MLMILAPARKFHPVAAAEAQTCPEFLDQTAALAAVLREHSAWELESILRCNPQLALEAAMAYQDFDPARPGAAAMLSYRGLCYQALDAGSFSAPELAFAQERVRIISALYGLLRPLDGIQPYRLEFTSRLRVKGQTLYSFWDDRIARTLYRDCDTAVCVSSSEYAKAVGRHVPPGKRLIDCVFLPRPGARKTVGSTLSKLARGAMVRFAVQHRLSRAEELREFEGDGYHFVRELSSVDRYLFAREM